MKNKIIFILLFVFATIVYAKPKIPPTSLPKNAQEFIEWVYPQIPIEEMKMDKGVYTVKLVNDAKISFTADGNWIKIEGYYNYVPEKVLPEAVINSITSFLSNSKIADVEKKAGVYKIRFSDRKVIRITDSGNIIYQGF